MQTAKTHEPIEETEFGIWMDFKEEQPEKAPLSMAVTEEGMLMKTREEQS